MNDQKIAVAVGKLLLTTGKALTHPAALRGPGMVNDTATTMTKVDARYKDLLAAAKGQKPLTPSTPVVPSQAKLASPDEGEKTAAGVGRKVVRKAVARDFEQMARTLLRGPLRHPLLTAAALGTAAAVPYAVHKRRQVEDPTLPTLQQFDLLGSMEQKAASAPPADLLSRIRSLLGATSQDMGSTKKLLPHLKERLMLLPIEMPIYAASGLMAERVRRAILPPLPTTIQIEVQNPNQKGKRYKPLIITSAAPVSPEAPR